MSVYYGTAYGSASEDTQYQAQYSTDREEVQVQVREFKKTSLISKIPLHRNGSSSRRSDGCCDNPARWLTLVLSILLLALGLFSMVVGIFIHVKYFDYLKYIGDSYVNIVTFFIVIGMILMVSGTAGIYGVTKQSYSATVFFLILVGLLCGLHIALGALAFHYRGNAKHATDVALSSALKSYYMNEKARKFVDWMQPKFKCCGIDGPQDWSSGNGTKTTKAPTTLTSTNQPTIVASAGTTKAITQATTVAATTATTKATTQATTKATTKATTEATTKVTTQATTLAATTATTKATTQATTKATTKATTEATTKVTTQATTTVATVATTKATTEATTEATTKVTTKATTKATTVNIVNAGEGFALAVAGKGIPKSCCKQKATDSDCVNIPGNIFPGGCVGQLDTNFVELILITIGTSAFIGLLLEILSILSGVKFALNLKSRGYEKF